jgi:sporulation integral membrane protein YlbJ
MLNIVRRRLDFSLFLVLIFLSLVFIFIPSLSDSVLDGMKLFFACVLPSLFPYFFITAILTELKTTSKISNGLSPIMKNVFNVNGVCGYAFFMSVIAGFPMGAKLVSDLKTKGFLTETESVRASAFCSTSSPVFLIVSVGSVMFKNTVFGVLLFLTNIMSAILVGIVFSFYRRKDKPKKIANLKQNVNVDFAFSDCVYSAVNSSLFVGAMIALFYTLTEVLIALKLLSPITFLLEKLFNSQNLASGITLGFFEITKGLKTVSNGGITLLSLPVSAFICGFGGISVIAQSVAFLKKAKIKTAPFVLAKTLSAIFSFIIGLVFSLVFFC